MEIHAKVSGHIHRPCEKVFDAIVNPDQIKGYFVSEAKGNWVPGQELLWMFADVCVDLQVEVLEVIASRSLSFRWQASSKAAIVNILLTATDEDQTQIQITEGPFLLDETEVQMAMKQTQGWTDFICSMKAYLYTGINLRSGQMS